MRISEVMTQPVHYVDPEAQLGEIAAEMRDNDCGAVPVAEQNRLIGMVTDRDIVVRGLAKGLDRTATARDVMSPEVLYCFEDESVEDVLENMGANQVRRLPVINRSKQLVGVVSLGDLSQAADKVPTGDALKRISEPNAPMNADRGLDRQL